MYVDKETLGWNPWDTDPWGKKRPCHLNGMRKMKEYSLVNQKQNREKQTQHQGMQQSLSKIGKGGKSYSKEFAKMHYQDKDLRALAEHLQGTTNSYNYSAA